MKVLVTVASRHHATRDIAEVIADELKTSGLDVDLRDAEDMPDIGAYDAVVLGSAVYTGSWLPAARHLVDFQGPALRKVPVWLFSSGPIGTDGSPLLSDPPEVPYLLKVTQAQEHKTFAGRLDKESLNLAEQLVSKVAEAPGGDFRDLGAIIEWARSITSYLQGTRIEGAEQRDQ